MKNKLKILFVLNAPLRSGLGIAKVHRDLKLAYEEMGHSVDYLDLEKILPNGNTRWQQIKGPIIQELFLKQLKKIASNYDVIDANYGCIPYSKESFGFNGVLLYRSHGLQPLYRIAEYSPAYKKMAYESLVRKSSFRNKIGNFLRFLTNKNTEWVLWDSLKYADIVHCLNKAEYDYLCEYGISKEKLIIIPNGIEDQYVEKSSVHTVKNQQRDEVTFLGSWTLRKGIKDIVEILEPIYKYVNKINLLGTSYSEEYIKSFFPDAMHSKLNIVTSFNSEQLPELLQNTKIGIFPSYVEGFGLAVVEQLACGIPVIAYKTPGPMDILKPILQEELLIPVGEKEIFAKRLYNLWNEPSEKYMALVEECLKHSQNFKYSDIAQKFINTYENKRGIL